MKRNALLTTIVLLLAPLAGVLPAAESAPARLNILFITADDMNHDSAGCYGCPIKDLTPNLDRLAAEGMRFQYAYSTVAVCQPVRRDHAYRPLPASQRRDGLLSPETRGPHAEPATARRRLPDLDVRQEPALPAGGEVLRGLCGDANQPFPANWPRPRGSSSAWPARRASRSSITSTAPTRIARSSAPTGPTIWPTATRPSRWIKPEEVRGVPGFLEDLPEVRREVAPYYTNVRRLDDCVGAVLKVLKTKRPQTTRWSCSMAATTACRSRLRNRTTTRTVPAAR